MLDAQGWVAVADLLARLPFALTRADLDRLVQGNEKQRFAFSGWLYRQRNLVERFFNRIKTSEAPQLAMTSAPKNTSPTSNSSALTSGVPRNESTAYSNLANAKFIFNSAAKRVTDHDVCFLNSRGARARNYNGNVAQFGNPSAIIAKHADGDNTIFSSIFHRHDYIF